MFKKLNVRDAEGIARRIAFEKARKQMNPDLVDLEEKLKESLGTRVRIEKKDEGGKLTIDFFSQDDLQMLFDILTKKQTEKAKEPIEQKVEDAPVLTEEEKLDMSEGTDMDKEDDDLYSINNFSV